MFHKLLQKQIQKYLPEHLRQDGDILGFLKHIDQSYQSFERDKELMNHAFQISEKEFHEVNDNLKNESKVRQITIEKLKEVVLQLGDDDTLFGKSDKDDLYKISEFINQQILKNKGTEDSLKRTVNLFKTLLANLQSGVLVENENREILFTNQLFCNMFEIPAPPDALVGFDCSQSAEQSKHLFSDEVGFVSSIDKILKYKKPVYNELIETRSGHFYERDYVPIFIDDQYKGHLWQYKDITERVRYEKLLSENEELNRLIMDNAMDAITLADTNGIIRYWNPAAAKLFGMSSKDAVGSKISETIIPLRLRDAHDAGMSRFNATGSSKILNIRLELPALHSDGHEFPIEMYIIGFEQQNEKLFCAFIKDITGRVEAQKVIDQQLQLQDLLINISSTYINIDLDKVEHTINKSLQELGKFVGSDRAYIFDYDFDANTTSNTYEWCEIGISPEIDNLQNIPLDFMPQWVEKHQQGQPFYIPDIELLPDEGPESLRGVLEPQGIKSLITIPMISKSKLIGFVGFDSVLKKHEYSEKEMKLLSIFAQMLINIFERRRKENLLTKQEEKYRNIIANMNLGLLEVMPDETIIFANQSFCDMSGYTLEDLKGHKTSQFLLFDHDQQMLKDKLKMREEGRSDNYELAVKNKQGEVRWWFVSGAPNYNDRNELIGSIGIHLDITNQKKLENELGKAKLQAEEASRAKETFLANMSHEIRTPLNAIIGMIRELGREDLTPKQNSYVSHSETAARHLLTIVNNILDMSKIEAGELVIDTKEFSLVSVIGNVISILHNRAHEKNLELKYNISSDIKPALIGDSGRMRQILINLVGNAIKFTDAGKIELLVHVNQTNQYFQQITFEVKDTGIGMSQEFLHKIFNKFSQEEGSAARRFEGTGLGMTITREMIHLMGGSCDIQTEKGKGTNIIFTLTLPIGDESKLVDKDSYLLDNSLQNLKILLVEDNEMNSFIARQSLQYFGCKVDTASNGKIAIEKLKTQKPDLILMDIQMPEMDGIEATKYIRNKMGITIPIVALTANAFKRDIDLYLSIGMNDYVTKPFEEGVLFNSIANTLNIKTKLPILSALDEDMNDDNSYLFDLTNIKNLSRGDQSFVKKMIEIFIEHTPTSIQEIKVAYKQDDFTTISKIAHRMKPSIDNMGIFSLKNPIRELESNAKMEVIDKNKIASLIDIIENTLIKVINELKAFR